MCAFLHFSSTRSHDPDDQMDCYAIGNFMACWSNLKVLQGRPRRIIYEALIFVSLHLISVKNLSRVQHSYISFTIAFQDALRSNG